MVGFQKEKLKEESKGDSKAYFFLPLKETILTGILRLLRAKLGPS